MKIKGPNNMREKNQLMLDMHVKLTNVNNYFLQLMNNHNDLKKKQTLYV